MPRSISNSRTWRNSPILAAVMLIFGCGLANISQVDGGELTNWFLGKTGTGSQRCDWLGCQCPTCYAPKCPPCTPKVGLHCADPYCKKPQPCPTKQCLTDCPDYCPKSRPCPPPFCREVPPVCQP